jgi:SAM-dependent methyltransferase
MTSSATAAASPSGGDAWGMLTPSAWVLRFVALPAAARVRLPAQRGTALDVAAGRGRHARLLAGLGYAVTAVDRDVGALTGLTGVTAVEANLEGGAPPPFAGRTFDLVVVTNYLHRPLLPALIAAVAPGGALVYETYARGNERYGRPTNPDYLLDRGELLAAVRGRLDVVAFEDGPVAWPRPAVVQRIAAIRAKGP